MRHCVATSFSAKLLLRGSVDGHRLDRRVSLSADRVSGSLRIESTGSKQTLFTFAVKDTFRIQTYAGWTLFSQQGNWVVQGEDSRAVMETIVGLPLSADEFLWTMTGCSPNMSGRLLIGQRFGPTLMKISLQDARSLDIELYKKNAVSPWALMAMSRNVPDRMLRWRMELGERAAGVIRRFRVVSRQSNGDEAAAFDVRISLTDVRVNPPLRSETFSLAVPASARVVSLETLRQQKSIVD